jgi:tRNA nucleotidyltransferase (CCA-adding enzyme)
MKITLPMDVKFIINRLNNHGYEAFAVGGCIRDSILCFTPKDWDICTDADPNRILDCFTELKTIHTGIKYGTVSVVLNDKTYDVTTYRTDGIYSDNRHPDRVVFIKSLKEDLSRRDFTINAMAYNDRDGFIDYFEGENDVYDKIIRCVGKCLKRFEEDALRILRALRFAATYNFTIEINTHYAIIGKKELLRNLHPQRIREELNKLLLCKGVEEILLQYSLVLAVVIPEIEPAIGYNQNNPYHIYDVWEHTVKSIAFSNDDLIVRLTMLLHDLSKAICYKNNTASSGYFYNHAVKSAEIAKQILERLKYDNDTIYNVYKLIFYHDTKISPDRIQIKRWLKKLGIQTFFRLLEVKKADAKAQNPLYLEKRLETYDKIFKQTNIILNQNLCFQLKDLNINGKDIILLGYKQGKEVGNILEYLLNLVIEEKVENKKNILIEEVKRLKKNKT